MIFNSMRILAAVAGAAVLAGCATVSSRHMGQGEPLDTSNPFCDTLGDTGTGTITCRPRRREDAASPAAAGVAYFLPRQVARVIATRTNNALDEAIKALVKAQSEVEAAQADVDAANAAIHQTEDAIIAGSGGAAAQPILAARLAALRTDLATATTALASKTTALDQAKTGVRTAATTAAAGANGPGAYKVTLKIELLPPSADPTQAYRLSPHHSAFRDDEHRLVVSRAGLLTSTDVVAVDRTGDILVEIATFAGAIAAGLPPIGARANHGRDPNRCKATANRSAPNEFTGIVDFADRSSVAVLNDDLQCLGVRLQAIGQIWPNSTRPASTSANGVDGIVYRTPVEVQVRIERCVQTDGACTPDSENWFPTEMISLSLPQAGPISYVRQDAGFMTRTRYQLAFSDGILTSYDASRPSELLEVARTPLRIVQGVFDGVSRVFSLQTGLTNAQLAALNADYALRAAQISGQTGLTNAQIQALNAEFALRAAQMTGQTSLTNAQLTALNAELALQTGQITAQSSINAAQSALLQSQTALTAGGNNAAAQVSASNLALTVSLLRDQARRETLNRCVAQQVGLGQPVDSCLVGY